jgi:hypothetical protein
LTGFFGTNLRLEKSTGKFNPELENESRGLKLDTYLNAKTLHTEE